MRRPVPRHDCLPGGGIASLTIFDDMGSMASMKTTIDIQDDLLARAKRHARRSGRPLRAVVEDGLRLTLAASTVPRRYRLPDLSVGNPGGGDPLEAYSWQDLRGMIYGDLFPELRTRDPIPAA